MRCCGSQTISTAPKVETRAVRASDGRAREVAVAFEGMLLRACLAPLAKPMGFYGDIALGACTQAIAEHSPGGFAAMLESLIERARQDGKAPS